MSRLTEHAEYELSLIGMGANTEDPINKAMHDHIIHMVSEFSKEGHSGFSAGYAINMLTKLLNFEPLSELTYAPDEWVDVSEMSGEPLWQNKRNSKIFSRDGGKTHYSLELN